MELINHIALEVWTVIIQSGPWLLLGLLIAGLIHELIPPGKIAKLIGEPGVGSVVRASAIGVPLPLCSCSVIPVAVSLRKSGASRGATASFLVSTPEIGVDSFLLSYGLLGLPVAVVRMLAAFVSALLVGIVIDRWEEPVNDNAANSTGPSTTPKSSGPSCCHHKGDVSSSKLRVVNEPPPAPRLLTRLGSALSYGFTNTLEDIAVSLSSGLLLAGLIAALVPSNFADLLNLSLFATSLLMLLVGLPLYVCATSSTPIAAALLAKGLNPGAAIVFLLSGPASNIATMLAVKSELGTRALITYLLGIGAVALGVGAIFDAIYGASAAAGYGHLNGPGHGPAFSLSHHHPASTLELILALIFVALLLRGLLKRVIARQRAV